MGERDLTTHIRPVPQSVKLPPEIVETLSIPEAGREELQHLIRMLFRYRYLIAGIITAFTLGGFIYAFTATKKFTAETQLKIEAYRPVLAATDVEQVLLQSTRQSDYIDTQIREMTSYSLADKVLSDDQIYMQLFPQSKESSFWEKLFGKKETPIEPQLSTSESLFRHKPKQIKYYLSHISVSPVRRTSIITVSATSPNRELSARMANLHAEEYINWIKSNRIKQQSEGIEFLKSQAEELKQKVATLERERAEYAETHSIVALNKDQNITVQRMAQLDNLLTSSTEQRIEAEKIYSEAEKSLATESAAFDDTSTQTSRAKLGELEAEYGNLSSKFTDSYPKMKQLKSQITEMKASIAAQRKQIVLGLKAKALAAEEKEKLLKEELEKQKSMAFELSKSEVQYNIISRELDSSRELLNSVLKQIKEMSVAVQSNASNVAIVDKAAVPDSASFPKKKLIIIVAFLLGIGTSLGLAIALQYLDNTIRSPDEIQSNLKLPSLGVIPSFDLNSHKQAERLKLSAIPTNTNESMLEDTKTQLPSLSDTPDILPIIFIQNSRSPIAEAYRSIRTGLLLSQASTPPKIILVTSAKSAEGKTTSTANLAATLASTGAKVLVIDADLRRPSMHRLFKLDRNLPGLVELLTGQLALEQVLIPDLAGKVSIIPAGTIPPNPAELLGSLEMVKLLEQLSRDFDHILIDSPPILPVTDSIILSRFVNGVVLVVRGAHTSKKIVRDAANRLRRVEANILGVILNDLDIKKADYYYYSTYYNSYYSAYGEESESKRKQAGLA